MWVPNTTNDARSRGRAEGFLPLTIISPGGSLTTPGGKTSLTPRLYILEDTL